MSEISIVGVSMLGTESVDIYLSNKNIIMILFQPLIERYPTYAPLKDKPDLPRPKTDGKSIYWSDGPRIGLQDIFGLLAMPPANKTPATTATES